MNNLLRSDYRILEISYADAMELVIKNHYLHRKAPCSKAFGLFHKDKICGVVVYGTPSSAPLRKGIAGSEYASCVVELTRLWCADDAPKNSESFLIGNTVKLAGKPIIVSYADASVGHIGYVYQATNWIYTGLSAKRTDWTIEGVNLHCQTIADKHSASELRAIYGERFSLKERPRKHRYLYINAKGIKRKKIMQAIRYPILPYPKLIGAQI
jgi:hypothetical protein